MAGFEVIIYGRFWVIAEATPERGGRAKRFFRVTAKGIAAVSRTHRALERLTEGLGFIRSYS
jgi:PadR family transcriptional regulator, regulatory protein PadR